jgi:hypothetical protein
MIEFDSASAASEDADARPLRMQPVALWSEFFRHNDGSISAHVGVCDEQYSYRWPARP